MATVVEARGVRKGYVRGRSVLSVLEGVDLSAEQGESVAIVGRSGAGKSTLLHILGGLDRPDGGSVILSGQDLYRLPSRHRTRSRASEVGFVFQSYHLLPEMDVVENVMLPAMALSRPRAGRAEARARAMKLLEAVGLGERARHTPLELSGGEQQRVALARALMNRPAVVLADEPTGNLDEETGNAVMKVLFEIMGERGHTLILVTHDEHTALACDRMLRLEDGILRGG